MRVLVDTSLWSLALRRKPEDLNPDEKRLERELARLIRAGKTAIIGAVRQEVLSGVKTDSEFERLRGYLRSFQDEPVTLEDHEQAARFYNRCRAKGVAGAHVDLLICAVADRLGLEIFTTDDDFRLYAEHLPIALHAPRDAES